MKIKLLLTSLIAFCLLFVGVKSAVALILSIQTLPSYINTNSFKLSCTTDGTTAQFYYSKNGGGFTAFGPAINVPTNSGGCVVQVDSTVVNDQTSYAFKVNVDGTDSTATSTFYDISGPSPVQNYYKEQVGSGFFKLHWKNPGDTDFDKVIIYRGESRDFSADNSHEIARVSGGPDSNMTYDDHQPDPNKTYYYNLRALDHAGNSSSLVGDGGTTITNSSSTPTPVTVSSHSVSSLPKEQGSGAVLGTSVTPTPSAIANPTSVSEETTEAGTDTGWLNWIMTHKKISLGVAAALAVLGYLGYRFTKKG